MLGALLHPSGRLLSDPSCPCSDSKLQVVLNKVFWGFLFAILFHNELLQHADPKMDLIYFDTQLQYCLFLLIYFTFLAFLEALPHLCQHVNLVDGNSDSRAVLCALIGLMEDSDPAVRISFSQSVRFLLRETTRNSEHSSLSEVSSGYTETSVLYTQFRTSKNHNFHF